VISHSNTNDNATNAKDRAKAWGWYVIVSTVIMLKLVIEVMIIIMLMIVTMLMIEQE
jgi:hypothetical protein